MDNRKPNLIRLLHVPFTRRGSTALLLDEAVKDIPWPDYSGILYLAPTPRKVRDSQKKFNGLVKSPYIPPQFFTLKQLAHHIFNREMPGRHFSQELKPILMSEISGHSLGYSRILSDIEKELKQHHPLKDLALIRQELSALLARLGIPEDASHQLHGALDIFERYRSALSSSGFYDDDDILNYSADAVSRVIDDFPVLIADGFHDMTPSEMHLLRQLIGKAGTSLISHPCGGDAGSTFPDMKKAGSFGDYVEYLKASFQTDEKYLTGDPLPDLSYVKYGSREDEIEGIARHLKNLAITGRFRSSDSIVVAFPDLNGYRELTARVFRRFGIPFTISAKRPVLREGRMRDVIYLLESIAEDFPRAKFASVLISPHFRNIPPILKTKTPSLTLTSGVVKGKSAWDRIGNCLQDRQQAEAVNRAVASVMSKLEGLIREKDSPEYPRLLSEIRRALDELGFESQGEDAEALFRALELISLIPGLSATKALSLGRAAEFLRHVLGSSEYATQETGVQIMDFFEARGLEPDYLYFCGLRDGDIPSRPPVDHVLPDSVRKAYGLVHLMKHLEIQKLVFLQLIGGSASLHLSYHSVEGDKLYLPSPFLPWSRELHEKTFGIFSRDELQARGGTRTYADSIIEIQLDAKAKGMLLRKELSMPLRVTAIDGYRRCPRNFFLEQILNVTAAEMTEYEIEARLLGTMLHRIMEELLKVPFESLEDLTQTARNAAASITGDYPLDPFWKQLITESLIEIIPRIFGLESELRSEGFQPFELEMKVSEEVLPGILLKGKIDRVDRKGSLFRVIDYKTGSVTVGSEILRKGKDLQLPLYSAMLGKRGMSVEKAGIYSLRDIGIKWIPTSRDRHSLDDYIEQSLSFLRETVSALREGNFPAMPIDEFVCSGCSEAPFCPYIHGKGQETA